jgi:hypothetical protein
MQVSRTTKEGDKFLAVTSSGGSSRRSSLDGNDGMAKSIQGDRRTRRDFPKAMGNLIEVMRMR